MANKTYHVVPNPSGGWNVQRTGAERATRVFSTKQDAVDWGRELSQSRSTVLVIHRKDGTVQEKSFPGAAPHPPGRKRAARETV